MRQARRLHPHEIDCVAGGGLGRGPGVVWERQRRVREYQRAMTESEAQLRLLSDESGGHMWLPESFDEMIADGAATARLIDSEYVLTYKPKLPVANAPAGEVRRLEVMSRRIGLTVISRRHYVAVSKREGSL